MSPTDVGEVRDLLGPLDPLRRATPVGDSRADPRAQALLAGILDGDQPDAAPCGGDQRRATVGGGSRLPRRLVLAAGALVAATAVASVAVVGLGVVPLPWNDTLPAAGAYAATPPPLAYEPVQGTAPEVLATIAGRTAALPDDAGKGRYARTEMQEWYLSTTVGGDGHTVTSVVMPQQSTMWLAADGSGRSVTRYQQPGIPWTTTDEATYAAGERSPWPILSPDDAAITRQLALGHPASNGPAERLVAINDLLRDQPMQPGVRAAVLRYLAATPTLELTGTVTDRLGRGGIGFSVSSDHSGLPTRYTLVVDPDDGRILAWEEMLTTTAGKLNVPIPSVIGYTAYRSSAYTDDPDH